MTSKRYPEAIEHYPQSMRIFIILISNRIDSGKNALIGVFGETGAGKSLSVLEIMRGIYLYRNGEAPNDEDIIARVFFNAKNFMNAMKDVSNSLVEKHLTKGVVWCWDEVGVDLGHKDFQSVRNKIIGWLAQTFRNQQQIIFFTTPSMSFIDASVRKLLHYSLEVRQIIKKKKLCIIKPLELQYNSRYDKMYFHNLIYPSGLKDGGILEIDIMGVPKVTNELEKLYDEKKNQFTHALNERILGMLENLEVKDKKKYDNKPKELTDRQQSILKLFEEGMTSRTEIAKIIGCSVPQISKNIGYMRGKGIDMNKFPKKIEVYTTNPTKI